MLNPSNLENGKEQYESFKRKVGLKTKNFVQYDFRDIDGELFSTVKGSIKECREARNVWLQNKQLKHVADCL